MAGSYPDVPSRRMAYDADGTVVLYRRTNLSSYSETKWTELSATDREDINDENPTSGISVNPPSGSTPVHDIAFIFPELREFDGWFFSSDVSGGTPSTSILATSGDTNNGIGGTFTTRNGSYGQGATTIHSYRQSITSFAVAGVRAVRYRFAAQDNQGYRFVRRAHIYGEISPGETPDRLLFIDEGTGVEFTASKDFGDIPRGSSEDFVFRLRNNSATLTINNIQYTAESLYESAGGWFTFSLPGTTAAFQATQQIASLAPSTSTGLITGRRVTPSAEALQVHAARVLASHQSLS